MTETFQLDVAKILIDKGVLGLVFLLLGAWLSHNLERLKASLSWGNELLKQRMTVGKSLLVDFKVMKSIHLNSVLPHAYNRQIANATEYFARRDLFLDHLEEARLVFPGAAVLELEQVQGAYERWLTSKTKPPIPAEELPARISAPFDPSNLSPQERAWSDAELRHLNRTIESALSRLQRSFPKETLPGSGN